MKQSYSMYDKILGILEEQDVVRPFVLRTQTMENGEIVDTLQIAKGNIFYREDIASVIPQIEANSEEFATQFIKYLINKNI